jgi:SSS family solute:Na+ symporter
MILLAGFVVIVIVAIPAAGGWDTIQATMEAAGKGGNLTFYGIGAMGVMGVVSLIYTIFIPCFGTPTYRMRIYTSKDDKSANRALLRSSGLLLVFSMFPAIIGMAAFTIATNTGADGVVANPDYAFAYVATIVLGPVLGLFFMIAGLSATMSSGDSDAIAGVTILIQDIYPKVTGKELPDDKVGTWSRIGVVLMLTMAFCATLFAKDVMGYISNVIGSIIPGVSVAMILGVMWKRVTWQGGLASIFSGLIFGVLFLAVASFREAIVGAFTGPAIPASLVALAFAVVVSLCTHNEQLSEDERMRLVIEGRGKKA